jgi:hypothetical protein
VCRHDRRRTKWLDCAAMPPPEAAAETCTEQRQAEWSWARARRRSPWSWTARANPPSSRCSREAPFPTRSSEEVGISGPQDAPWRVVIDPLTTRPAGPASFPATTPSAPWAPSVQPGHALRQIELTGPVLCYVATGVADMLVAAVRPVGGPGCRALILREGGGAVTLAGRILQQPSTWQSAPRSSLGRRG